MAGAAVSFVLKKLADPALKQALEIYNLGDQVVPMQVHLRFMESFLKDADSEHNKNQPQLVKQLVKEVREVTHKIEDAIDTFLVEIEENRPKKSGVSDKIRRVVRHPLKLHWFRNEIKEIELIFQAMIKTKSLLGDTGIGATSTSEEASVEPFRPSRYHEIIEVSEVVGFDADADMIIRHLLDENIRRLAVMSIVGIGGIGKTTLAKKVYERIRNYYSNALGMTTLLKGFYERFFPNRHFQRIAWVSISKRFDLADVLRTILDDVWAMQKREPCTYWGMTEFDLSTELRESLDGRRFLIILDDVWSTDLWDKLSRILPNTENGSRILITSRDLAIARYFDQAIEPHVLSCLRENDSETLLLQKALPKEQLDNYPYLKDITKELTQKCGGLPLALIVLGGILSKKVRTYRAWLMVKETLDWHTKEGEQCSSVLAMSYNDLPYHLKQCFLYFSSFPGGYNISAKYVTRMWIVEGFIPTDASGALEDNANVYLEELVDRCLIQVTKKSWDGCKYCGVHDLLLDLAIHKAKADSFLTVFPSTGDGSQKDVKVARRVAIQFSSPPEYDVLPTNTRSPPEYDVLPKNTRSLFLFNQGISNYDGLRLLKVLTFECVVMREKKLNYKMWLEGLIHLKYLGFRNCGVLPSGFGCVSFRSMKNLETLDFKGTYMRDKPDDSSLWEVSTLRHVILESRLVIQGPWDRLKNLKTLKWVSLQKIPELGCNLNLHTLALEIGDKFVDQEGSIENARDKFEGLLKRMEFLVSLRIEALGNYLPFPVDGTANLPCHEHLQCLHLDGRLPEDFTLKVEIFPTNLTKLTLQFTCLKEDPMPVLERLESLSILRMLYDAYDGTELTCSRGGFPNLQKLELGYLPRLCQWDINEGAMPKLLQLIILRCGQLHILPKLQNLPTVQALTICRPSRNLCERMQSEDQYKINHIPSVQIENPEL